MVYRYRIIFHAGSLPESGTKTLRSMGVYTKPGKQPSDTISCQNNFITSTIFIVFFAYLPSNRSTSFALKLSLAVPNCYISQVGTYIPYNLRKCSLLSHVCIPGLCLSYVNSISTYPYTKLFVASKFVYLRFWQFAAFLRCGSRYPQR